LTIYQEGSYSVSFTAILANPDAVNERIMTVFIALDGEFDPNKAIANIAVLPPSGIGSASTTSILKNVKKGTKISLAMTSG